LQEDDIGEPTVRTARHVAEGYRARTLKNVQDSDGTVILFSATPSGGTLQTRNSCVRKKRPFVVLDAKELTALRAADAIVRFLDEHAIEVLNVASPRASGVASRLCVFTTSDRRGDCAGVIARGTSDELASRAPATMRASR
jgi:hypothetical protein